MAPPRLIASRQNSQFKRWLSLLESQGVKTHQQCLVSGTKLRQEITQDSRTSICEILWPSSYEGQEEQLSYRTSFTLSKELFHELDVFGTKEPLLVCPTPSIPLFDLTKPPLGLEILCPIGDPGNLGALLRSCWAFGVRTMILLREAVHPFHPKVIRASSGAVFAQSLSQGCSISELQTPEILQWISALDMQGNNIATFSWPQPSSWRRRRWPSLIPFSATIQHSTNPYINPVECHRSRQYRAACLSPTASTITTQVIVIPNTFLSLLVFEPGP